MKLFEPIKIGSLQLKNRIAMPAIHHAYCPNGLVNERLIEYYRVRAQGGAGLITVGGCAIDQVGSAPQMIALYDDQFIDGLQALSRAIKSEGAAAAAQLYQAGRYTHSFMTGHQPIAPSPLASRLTREEPREMTLEDIEMVIENFAEAAGRVKQAGFDALEIIASAGYLICQFLSPVTNQRSDDYGGSWENRIRFGLEVVRRVRGRIGPGFPLLVRISGNDFMPGGNSNHEMALFASVLEKEGVDCINVTGGWHESRIPQITGELPRGGYAYLAEGIRIAVNVPVMASNRINDPLVAEQILQLNMADLVNMGRPLIADPDLPNKAARGDFGAIRRCIACNQGCLDMVFTMQDVHCSVNPQAGRELETVVEPAVEEKKVLIIGGGPAGLETARIAAARGHRVVLWEKAARLGGHLRYAAMPPGKEDFITLLEFYENQLPRLGVEILLNREAGPMEVAGENADLVVLATGSKPAKVPFPVETPGKVVSALEALDGSVIPGKKVVVIGGGSVGCETALHIAAMGTLSANNLKFLFEHDAEEVGRLKELINRGTRDVTLVELEKGIGRDIGISTRWVTLQCIRRAGVKVIDGSIVQKISEAGVEVETGGEKTILPADTVVLAVGAKANDSLAEELENLVPELHLIGDVKKPRKITEAIREGFELGRSL